MTKRRRLIKSAGGIGAVAGIGGLGAVLGQNADAQSANSTFSITGDNVVTDDGTISTLTVELSTGQVSYDGLDEDANRILVILYARIGGSSFTANDEIARTSFTLGNTSQNAAGLEFDSIAGFGTRAGSAMVDTPSPVNVFNSDSVSPGQFEDTTESDGPKQTDVIFGLRIFVRRANNTAIVRSTSVDTATISVLNELAQSATDGLGSTSASGSNQEP
jgi:hypothetical protein